MVGRSFCAGHYTRQEQHHPHKFHHQFVSSSSSPTARQSQLQDLNIAPRKLLSLRAAAAAHSPNSSSELMPDSPDEVAALMQKFLPYNGEGRGRSEGIKDDGFDPDADPYSSDQFRMFEFKIRRCTRSRSHDWTDCPFSHPGEKAKRRDPRKYHYSGTVCPESRRCGCPKGDDCEFAHGVFECWLHPSRYRTEACKDGKNCKRKVCFFAHSPRELRVLPPQDDGNYEVAAGTNKDQQQKYCCKCCSLSPTSTLMGTSHFSSSPPMSPTLSSSPPISPTMRGRGGLAAGGFSRSSLSSPCATSRYSDWMSGSGGDHVGLLSYEDIIMNEIVNSLGKNMSLSRRHRDEFMAAAGCGFEGTSPNGNMSVNQKTRPWVDVNFAGVNGSAAGYGVGDGDERYQQQQQFVLSPSPTICTDQSPIQDSSVRIHKIFFSASTSSDSGTPVRTDSCSSVDNYVYGFAEDKANMDPDLGWINDLLM